MYHFGLYWHFYPYLPVSTSITQAQYHKLSSVEAATITPRFSAKLRRHFRIESSSMFLGAFARIEIEQSIAKFRPRELPNFPPIFGAAHRADRFRRYSVSPPLYNQQLEVSVHIFDLRTHNFMSSIRKRCGKAYINLCQRLNKSQ